MKRYTVAALGTLMTALATLPAAANEVSDFAKTSSHIEKETVLVNNPVEDIQKTRLNYLENSNKSVEDIQKTRLDYLENSSKSVEDIHITRLDYLENQRKSITSVN